MPTQPMYNPGADGARFYTYRRKPRGGDFVAAIENFEGAHLPKPGLGGLSADFRGPDRNSHLLRAIWDTYTGPSDYPLKLSRLNGLLRSRAADFGAAEFGLVFRLMSDGLKNSGRAGTLVESVAESLDRLESKVARIVQRRPQVLVADTIANLSIALAYLNRPNQAILELIDAAVPDRVGDFRNQHIADILKCNFILNRQASPVIDTLYQAIRRRESVFGTERLIQAMMHFSIFDGERARSLWPEITSQLQSAEKSGMNLQSGDIGNLHRACTVLGLEFPGWMDEARAYAVHGMRLDRPASNGFEKSVGQALYDMGVDASAQRIMHFYHVDFFAVVDHIPLIIECDGRNYHYVGGDPARGVLGNDALKGMVFERAGYQVVRVDIEDWDRRNDAQRMAWLEGLISAALHTAHDQNSLMGAIEIGEVACEPLRPGVYLPDAARSNYAYGASWY